MTSTSDMAHQGSTINEASMENQGSIKDPQEQSPAVSRWKRWFGGTKVERQTSENDSYRLSRTFGILSDKQTHEVPGESNPAR